jgi:DegV family protein with EDD domain
MSKSSGEIVIVHDSASSLPADYSPEGYKGLVEVPFKITSVSDDGQNKQWVDHAFISDEERAEFVHDLETTKITTSLPSPGDYKKAYEKIIETGITEIAVVPMSSVQSGSMQSAITAAEIFEDQPNIHISVADCKTVSIGQGLLVTQADIENQNGEFKNAAEVVDRVNELSKGVYVAQGFSNIEHLRRGGRIGPVSGMLCGVMGIIPIIGEGENGELKRIDQKRGWKKTREAILNHVASEVGDRAVRLALVYFESDQVDAFRSSFENDDRFVRAVDVNGEKYDMLECEERMVTCVHSSTGIAGGGGLVIPKRHRR